MSISRETFDPTKNYKRIRYHQDRDLLDSELNEQQDIINLERSPTSCSRKAPSSWASRSARPPTS